MGCGTGTDTEDEDNMRINIYNEEITGEVTTVSTVAENTGITYYGTRIFLASAKELHNKPDDDDRSAVTIWSDDKEITEELTRVLAEKLGMVAKS